MGLKIQTYSTGGRGRGLGKAFGGFAGAWVGFQEAIGVSQFQDAINHTGGASETKRTSGCFQAGKTIHDFSQATAVEFAQFAEIEDNTGLAITEQLIESELQLFALDAHLERPAQFEDDDPRFEFFSYDLHEHLS